MTPVPHPQNRDARNPRSVAGQPVAGLVFDEPWEAQTFALVVALNERGVFTWAEWTEAVAAAPEHGYYERWLATLERLVSERGLISPGHLERYRHAWQHAAARTPHGTPIELDETDFA